MFSLLTDPWSQGKYCSQTGLCAFYNDGVIGLRMDPPRDCKSHGTAVVNGRDFMRRFFLGRLEDSLGSRFSRAETPVTSGVCFCVDALS